MRVEFYLKMADETGTFQYTTILLCAKKMSFVPSIGMEICNLRSGDPNFNVAASSVDFSYNYAKVFLERA